MPHSLGVNLLGGPELLMVSGNDDSLKIGGWLGTNAGEAGLKIPSRELNIPGKIPALAWEAPGVSP